MTTRPYKYGGARALVALHERHLREFLETWRTADEQGLELPETANSNYASREALLAHVLGCAARYLVWICAQMGVAAPELEERPPVGGFASRARAYLEEVLAAWRGEQLRELTEERAYAPAHAARWGPPYCIDAMLEHAVMHPIRHTHQLRAMS